MKGKRPDDEAATLPADVTVTMHQCRGNREGGRNAVAEIPLEDLLDAAAPESALH